MPGTDPTFGMTYPVDLDPLADWPAIMQGMVDRIAATMKGRVVNVDVANLQDEVAARAAADTTQGNQITAQGNQIAALGTPMSGEYYGSQTGVTSGSVVSIPQLSIRRQSGGLQLGTGTNPTVTAGPAGTLTFPPGLWSVHWLLFLSAALTNGRNFALISGEDNNAATDRRPYASTGEDQGGASFMFSNAATKALTFQHSSVLTATATINHVIRVTRLGGI